MATTKACDVYGGTKDVQTYNVIVKKQDDAGTMVFARTIDLGPRALERLRKFVERGTTRPSEGDGNGT